MRALLRMLLVYSLLMFVLVGCASRELRRDYFSETQDSYVGRSIEDYWLARPASITYEVNIIIYNYINYETGCEWKFIVDKKNNVILRWAYISAASRCYEQINWLGPW